jgi:hypothetical protein
MREPVGQPTLRGVSLYGLEAEAAFRSHCEESRAAGTTKQSREFPLSKVLVYY